MSTFVRTALAATVGTAMACGLGLSPVAAAPRGGAAVPPQKVVNDVLPGGATQRMIHRSRTLAVDLCAPQARTFTARTAVRAVYSEPRAVLRPGPAADVLNPGVSIQVADFASPAVAKQYLATWRAQATCGTVIDEMHVPVSVTGRFTPTSVGQERVGIWDERGTPARYLEVHVARHGSRVVVLRTVLKGLDRSEATMLRRDLNGRVFRAAVRQAVGKPVTGPRRVPDLAPGQRVLWRHLPTRAEVTAIQPRTALRTTRSSPRTLKVTVCPTAQTFRPAQARRNTYHPVTTSGSHHQIDVTIARMRTLAEAKAYVRAWRAPVAQAGCRNQSQGESLHTVTPFAPAPLGQGRAGVSVRRTSFGSSPVTSQVADFHVVRRGTRVITLTSRTISAMGVTTLDRALDTRVLRAAVRRGL